jgi:hypothetical protein
VATDELAKLASAVERRAAADGAYETAATEAGCDRFLTNDTCLSAFPDLAVEVLP